MQKFMKSHMKTKVGICPSCLHVCLGCLALNPAPKDLGSLKWDLSWARVYLLLTFCGRQMQRLILVLSLHSLSVRVRHDTTLETVVNGYNTGSPTIRLPLYMSSMLEPNFSLAQRQPAAETHVSSKTLSHHTRTPKVGRFKYLAQ